MYISNAGPHQPMAASFFNLQDQIKYVCMYVCMYCYCDTEAENETWQETIFLITFSDLLLTANRDNNNMNFMLFFLLRFEGKLSKFERTESNWYKHQDISY